MSTARPNFIRKLFSNFNGIQLSRPLLNLLFITALIALIFLSFFSGSQVRHLITNNNWVIHTYQVIQKIDSILFKVIEIESQQRGYIITNDEQLLNDIEQIKENLKTDTVDVINLTKDNKEQAKRIIFFNELIEQRISLLNQVLKLKTNHQFDEQIGKDTLKNSINLSNRVKGLGQEIKSVEAVLLKERNQLSLNNVNQTELVLGIGNIFSFIFLFLAFLLVNTELSTRKKAEILSNNNQTRLRKIIESVSDMIAAFDKNGCFIIFNEAYRKEFKLLFGKSISIGMSLNEALADIAESKKPWATIWKESIEWDDYATNAEFTINNEKNFYEITANLIENIDQQIIGSVQSIRNITKRISEHTELQKMYEIQALGLEELEKKNHHITLLVEMSDIMLACNSQEEVSVVMAKFPQRLLHFASGYLYVMHPSKNYLERAASWGTPSSQEIMFAPDQCWAIKLGRKHQVNNSHNELICNHIKTIESEDVSFVCVPLMAQNDVFGLLYLETSAQNQYLNDENERLLINAFAELTALALANVRLRDNLRHQSIRDPLTGLYNRRYLEDFLFKQIHQAERNKAPFSILMLDLDHFKKINDTFGHDAGDAALKEVGKILQHDIRVGDIATRYGGEEFIIMFYNIDLESTMTRADKIREDVARIQLKYGAQQIGQVTISIGLACYPSDGVTSNDLIEAADKALYHAKKTGRNKIVVYSDINAADNTIINK